MAYDIPSSALQDSWNKADQDDVYASCASTALFAVLRMLLALSMARGWVVQVGDISTAFLHAARSNSRLGTQYSDHHKGVLHQPKHSPEATQGNVWPTRQPESMAGALSKSAYRPQSQKITVRARCLHPWQSLPHGLR